MAVHYLDSGSISDLVVSNSLRATGSLFGTASYLSTAGFAQNQNIKISDSVSSNTVSQLIFSNANGVSFGLNGSTLTATGGGGGGGNTYPYFNPQDAYVQAVVTGWGLGSLFMRPIQVPNVQFDRVAIPLYVSATTQTASTMGLSLTFSWGLYSRNQSSFSLMTNYTTNTTFQGTIGSNQTATANGIRLWTMGLTNTLSEGQYYAALITSVISTRGTLSNIVASQQASSFFGLFGQPSAQTIQYTRGLGFYSTSTSAFPSSIAVSELYGCVTGTVAANSTNTLILRSPIFYIVSQTF